MNEGQKKRSVVESKHGEDVGILMLSVLSLASKLLAPRKQVLPRKDKQIAIAVISGRLPICSIFGDFPNWRKGTRGASLILGVSF